MIGAGQLYACSGQLQCGEFRPWVGWQVDQSVVPFPLCDDYLRGTLAGGWVPSYASQVAFADLEAIVASKIDHDNLPVIFALQRLIDSIDIITSGQPDLTEKTPKIPFGANTGLCLSLKHPSGQGIWVPSLDSCSSTSPLLNWSYDRASGEITNVNTGLCLGVQGALTLSAPNGAIQVVACTNTDPTLVSDELQVWDWNPESGVIKNPLGPVLAVTDAIPQVGSLVSAAPANPWHLNQYVWTNGVSSSCSPAVCPAPGLAAWKQGPIPGTTQVYPKDFNIFAYVGASVTNTDVAGPVAAWKGITAQSFSINAANHMPDRPPVALVAGLGNLGLFVGGSEIGIMYAGPKQSDLDGNVNIASSVWLNPAATVRNPNPTRTNPINFEMAFENLQGMSTALTKYPAVGTVRPGVTMQLNSGSSKLAVFYVNGSDLSNARTIQFIVPASATVLINVSGTQVAIQNVGIISGQLDPSNMLWNFYEATSLKMSSITLPGSVLAPLAAAELSWGAVNGTMAAWSVNTTSQFHWCPFHNNALVAGP
jgi:choice-of-anchor A domain-containing protein